jgi:hypothetical protein
VIKKKWTEFRHWWESEEELQSNGPSKSEYFILIILYPLLYLLSGIFHELGHFIGAIITGAPVVGVDFKLFGFSVSVNGFGKDLTMTRLLGGFFQGVFLLPFSKRYDPLRIASIFCFIYAIAEALRLEIVMLISAFISEIIVCLVIIVLAR